MNLDAKTGLPELPDGRIWRVKELKSEESKGFMFFSLKGIEIQIIEQTSTLSMEPEYWPLPFGIKVQRGLIARTEDSEEIIASKWITELQEIKVDTYDDDGEVTGTKMVEQVCRVQPEELTSAIVLENAKALLEEHQASLLGRSYIGDYPPKAIRQDVDYIE